MSHWPVYPEEGRLFQTNTGQRSGGNPLRAHRIKKTQKIRNMITIKPPPIIAIRSYTRNQPFLSLCSICPKPLIVALDAKSEDTTNPAKTNQRGRDIQKEIQKNASSRIRAVKKWCSGLLGIVYKTINRLTSRVLSIPHIRRPKVKFNSQKIRADSKINRLRIGPHHQEISGIDEITEIPVLYRYLQHAHPSGFSNLRRAPADHRLARRF
jgi:hypothetical protein